MGNQEQKGQQRERQQTWETRNRRGNRMDANKHGKPGTEGATAGTPTNMGNQEQRGQPQGRQQTWETRNRGGNRRDANKHGKPGTEEATAGTPKNIGNQEQKGQQQERQQTAGMPTNMGNQEGGNRRDANKHGKPGPEGATAGTPKTARMPAKNRFSTADKLWPSSSSNNKS